MSIWNSFKLNEDEVYYKNIGDLHIWIKLRGMQLQIAHTHTIASPDSVDADNPPEGIVWSRWEAPSDSVELQFAPLFPDRPVVIKPEESFRLMQRTQTRIYARAPIWIGIDLEYEGDKRRLMEAPTAALSKTWFGSFEDGESCHWISSGLKRRIEPDPRRQYLAICPMELKNSSNEEALIERICLRVIHLSLFLDGAQLWSDKTSIVYKGKDDASRISVSGMAPEEAASATLIAEPRIPLKKGFTANAFATLKDLSGLGETFR